MKRRDARIEALLFVIGDIEAMLSTGAAVEDHSEEDGRKIEDEIRVISDGLKRRLARLKAGGPR